MFLSQLTDIVGTACPESAPGASSGWTSWKYIILEVEEAHPSQMPEPPQLDSFDVVGEGQNKFRKPIWRQRDQTRDQFTLGEGLPGSQSGIGSRLGVLAWRATWGLPSYGATTCRKCCKGLVHCQLSGSSDDPIPGKNLHYSNFWHSVFVLFAAGVCDLNVPRYEEFSKAVNTRSSVISGLHHSSLVKYGKTLILFGLLTHIE